ncbi:alpha/beta hydrolase [Lactobacillus sp. ESL0791]|uniref:alpha/beta hydrolase n=1 Tax=Lactobacillus sp. ESL0791 TaxID=2983234 RepID=UPI0023F7045E|nr:alpha/beta hydrolase [Lactobacillus sp. ESL0791]MDF7638152.1 alpha/beta hydrolase [Lactobacillus sp. ESL0791]
MKVENLTLTNFNGREFKIHNYMLANIGDLVTPMHPLAIVIPGGSFDHLSKREGEPVALAFNNRGFNSVVMEYNLVQEGDIYPDAGLDVLTTVKYFRERAAKYNIDPEKIVTIGFSAGGHVASIANAMANAHDYQQKYGFKAAAVRPNKTILGYPLINIEKIGFDVPDDEEDLVPDDQFLKDSSTGVTRETPATFIFHAWDDPMVLVTNTLEYIKALHAKEVPCEVHIFNKGGHGFSLARTDMVIKDREFQDNPHAGHWFDLAIEWLNSEWGK